MENDKTVSLDDEEENRTAAVDDEESAQADSPEATAGDSAKADTDVPVGELMERLEKAQAEAEQFRDRYLRAMADMDNFRKRSVREREEMSKFGIGQFIEKLLPVVDHFELGLQAARQHPEAKPVTEGFEMVSRQLERVLTDSGVEAEDPLGEAFDPQQHECIAHQPSPEVDEDHVMAVVKKGYRLNGRLLRPASVVVSSGKPADEES